MAETSRLQSSNAAQPRKGEEESCQQPQDAMATPEKGMCMATDAAAAGRMGGGRMRAESLLPSLQLSAG